jgi:signal peptidase I
MPGRILASPPKRGDVIVFKLPRDGETDYIKRLIGLPGDHIQMINNRLYINGQMVDRQPLPPYPTSGRFGEPVQVPHYIETLPGGVKHEIIQLEGDNNPMPYTANTDVYVVPPDHYFFMGDNRDNSSDSRVPPDRGGVGYVPFENLIGRAEVIFFSVDGAPAWEVWQWPWTVRWSRMFHAVH